MSGLSLGPSILSPEFEEGLLADMRGVLLDQLGEIAAAGEGNPVIDRPEEVCPLHGRPARPARRSHRKLSRSTQQPGVTGPGLSPLLSPRRALHQRNLGSD